MASSTKEVQSFMGLTSFYRKFIKNFSSITTPITDCLKKGGFVKNQQNSFEIIKLKLSSQPILKLPEFNKPFEVVVDAYGARIGAVLSQGGHPVEFSSDKLSIFRQSWSTYEQELYALVRTLKQWEHYLLSKEFILLIDHFSLKFLQAQKDSNRIHAPLDILYPTF